MEHAKNTQGLEGPATVLAIGTATPPNTFIQTEVPDVLFKLANIDHLTELKMKFTRICKQFFILMFNISLKIYIRYDCTCCWITEHIY